MDIPELNLNLNLGCLNPNIIFLCNRNRVAKNKKVEREVSKEELLRFDDRLIFRWMKERCKIRKMAAS